MCRYLLLSALLQYSLPAHAVESVGGFCLRFLHAAHAVVPLRSSRTASTQLAYTQLVDFRRNVLGIHQIDPREGKVRAGESFGSGERVAAKIRAIENFYTGLDTGKQLDGDRYSVGVVLEGEPDIRNFIQSYRSLPRSLITHTLLTLPSMFSSLSVAQLSEAWGMHPVHSLWMGFVGVAFVTRKTFHFANQSLLKQIEINLDTGAPTPGWFYFGDASEVIREDARIQKLLPSGVSDSKLYSHSSGVKLRGKLPTGDKTSWIGVDYLFVREPDRDPKLVIFVREQTREPITQRAPGRNPLRVFAPAASRGD